MLKARVFPCNKNMIIIIWFCILYFLHMQFACNLHYHVWSSMVYVTQTLTQALLLAWVAIVFTPNNVRNYLYIYSNVAQIYRGDMMQIFDILKWPWKWDQGHISFHTEFWLRTFFRLVNSQAPYSSPIPPPLDPTSRLHVLCKWTI